MAYIAFVLLVIGVGLLVVGGLVIFFSPASGQLAGQSDREAQFLATEMAASYDAAKHVRGDLIAAGKAGEV